MTLFHIPPPRIDLHTLPLPLMTSEPGSFAHNTLAVRVPGIIRETIALNTFPADLNGALQELTDEIVSKPIRMLQEQTPDKEFWWQVWRDDAGRTWLDAPWYLAESFVYRRILEATRYFSPGPWQGFDPFRAKKQTELEPSVAPRMVEMTLRHLPADPGARFGVLLYASLWGNRIDLSYAVAAQVGRAARLEDERVNLLVDDAERVWNFLRKKQGCRVAFLEDNAGTELLMDLALADVLLTTGMAAQVDLHLKAQPFFVSDAMPQDVGAGLDALARGGDEARALGQRVRAHLAGARLRLRPHWFYTTSLHYFQLPDDLHTELASMDFVIVKGDANYRRLLGDAHWPTTTPFEQATAYFPAPFVALRTLKAELIVGLREGEAKRLQREDPQWLVNGRRGLVQARLPV